MRRSYRILTHETKPGIVVVPGKSGDDIPELPPYNWTSPIHKY
ncbi:type II toxin-antitoxin system HicA family toxin [Microcystis aeruginosa EAWAG127a]|uniref:Type II toxin-antitoxin system HicA family toxin n=1 Tax=Microcystis aeruginosa EAWAG127a TaxID=2529855 RepID=A0A5J5LSZ1_MICAE|nr:type II toxin-antitoxin system HicA family toxin [Microcystis aeruginosa EAWAG127a]